MINIQDLYKYYLILQTCFDRIFSMKSSLIGGKINIHLCSAEITVLFQLRSLIIMLYFYLQALQFVQRLLMLQCFPSENS